MAIEEGEDKMIFVVTPLNLLGKQNVDSLGQAGLRAIAVSSENANATVYKVRCFGASRRMCQQSVEQVLNMFNMFFICDEMMEDDDKAYSGLVVVILWILCY